MSPRARKDDEPLAGLPEFARKIGRAYGAVEGDAKSATRVSYLIGTDGRIERAYGKVNAKEHPAAALAELEE